MSEQDKFIQISLENGVHQTRATGKFHGRRLYERQDPGIVRALIPGTVAAIETAQGKTVRQGDTVMILEAMKMLNRIKAPKSGTVRALRVAEKDKVAKGQILFEIE